MTIAIVTDSAAYLSTNVVERYGIHVVSLYVHIEGEAIRETEIADSGDYFRALAAMDRLATTSQPSIGDFLAVYEPLVAEGHQVLSMHLSGAMSGTVNAAAQARRALGDAADLVRVVDTRVACGAEGMMVQSAATAIARGADIDSAVARAQELRQHLNFWFALDTLEYLRKGGRIGGAQAWLGSALKIKPILSVAEEITPVERVRTSARAFERIVARLERAHAEGADGWAIQHIRADAHAEALAARGRMIFGTDPWLFSEIGPVIGTHIGPGMFGAGAFPAHLVR